jgi:gamma-glutamyltranspeptidase/glutathione hydrolase
VDPSQGAVAAPRHEAVEAGEAILEAGGTAVDAAVAVAAVLAVVEPYMTGPGALIEGVTLDATGRCDVLDGAAHAPKGATADMFRVIGPPGRADYAWPEVEAAANVYGGLAVAAPRWAAGLWALHRRSGRIPWADLFTPAIELARDGFRVDYFTAAVVAREMGTLSRDPEAARLYYPGGLPLSPPIDGPETRVANPALVTTLEAIAQDGPDALARGPIADAIVRTVRDRGGVLAHGDLTGAFGADVIGPVRPAVRFRDHDILVSPRPSGGVTVGQILGILDAAGPPAGAPMSVERYTRFARASIAAFESRLTTMSGGDDEGALAEFLGLDRLRAAAAAMSVIEDRPHPPPSGNHPSTATTCFAVADGESAIVAVTTTLLSFFGSQVGVEGYGFHLNDAMLYFDPRPGNSNSIASGKRALAAVAPLVMVSPDGTRRTAIAGLGARRIISATAQAVENRVDHGLALQEAIDLPRVHVDTVEALVDERLPSDVADAIERLGWPIRREHYGPTTAGLARLMAVETDRQARTSTAAIDLRSQATWRFEERWR